MTKREQLYLWLAGFIIYSSLLMLLNHFVDYALNQAQFALLSIISYALCLGIILFKKWFVRLFVLLLLLIGLCYGADRILENQFQNEIIVRNDWITTQNEDREGTLSDENKQIIESNPSLGYSAYKKVHKVVETINYANVFDFVMWLTEKRNVEDATLNLRYEQLFFVLVSFGLSALLLLIYKYKYSKMLLLMPLLGFVYMWYQYVDLPRNIYMNYFIGITIFFVIDQQIKLKKATLEYGQKFYLSGRLFGFAGAISLLVIIVATLVTAFFPLDAFNRITDPLIPNFWGGRSGYPSEGVKMYTLNDTPFQSSNNKLGGPIDKIDRDTVLFSVQMDQKQSKSLYLKGNVKDFYDGYQWVSRANTYRKEYEYFLSEEKNVDYLSAADFKKISGTIRMENLETVTLFTPLGLYQSSLGNKVYISIDNEAFYKAGAFVKYLGEYKFSSAGVDFLKSDEVDYLQLPTIIDNGIFQLSRNLAQYGQTDYEKMVIMTKFLLQNFEYTLYPPAYEKDREFVSKFIFDTRKGYCTYFATALTVMARINEIPARYVEGFRIDPDQEDVDGFAAVTEGDAHAWCEVYIEGKGWTVFESTPPFSGAELTLERKSNQEIQNIITEAGGPLFTQTTAEVNDFKEGLLEDNMLLGDDGGNSGRVKPEAEESKVFPILKLILAMSIILMMGLSFIIVSNMAVLRQNGKRERALVLIYYLEFLLKTTQKNGFILLDHLIANTQLTIEEQTVILELVYNSKKAFKEEEVLKTVIIIEKAIDEAETSYKKEWGVVRLLLLKMFSLKKIVL